MPGLLAEYARLYGRRLKSIPSSFRSKPGSTLVATYGDYAEIVEDDGMLNSAKRLEEVRWYAVDVARASAYGIDLGQCSRRLAAR